MARTQRRSLTASAGHDRESRRLSLVPSPVGETYYLDIYGSGLVSRDDQGEQMPDIHAARVQAILTATYLLRATLDPIGSGQTVTVVVRDDDGERYRITIYSG